MLTQSHMGLAVALLGKRTRDKSHGFDPSLESPNRQAQLLTWVIFGAWLPDLLMFVMIAVERLNGHAMQVIFEELYYTSKWQVPLDWANSIPLFVAIAFLGYFLKWRGVVLMSLAALLHIFFDLPLHREDAHRHFWPLSDYQFISPVSYWDKDYNAKWWSPIEFALITWSMIVSWKFVAGTFWKYPFYALMALGILMQGATLWWHWIS